MNTLCWVVESHFVAWRVKGNHHNKKKTIYSLLRFHDPFSCLRELRIRTKQFHKCTRHNRNYKIIFILHQDKLRLMKRRAIYDDNVINQIITYLCIKLHNIVIIIQQRNLILVNTVHYDNKCRDEGLVHIRLNANGKSVLVEECITDGVFSFELYR